MLFAIKTTSRLKVLGSNNRIKYDDVYCWSDSEIALAWIRGKEKCWEPWVEHTVVAIRKMTDRSRWNFVKGELTLRIFRHECRLI